MTPQTIFIGGAWPYANGPLHVGHIASLLCGDVLARFHRAKGDKVFYASGSDCHGTPIALKAKQEGQTPLDVSDHYHASFESTFARLGFSYDVYTKTSSEAHHAFVKIFHEALYQSPHVFESLCQQPYCPTCQTFLPDRFVTGLCPACHESARGDQCDACGRILEPEQLISAACAICQTPITLKHSSHLFLRLCDFEAELKALTQNKKGWRANAIAATERYIKEGLRDRALTRDLDWGIDVPHSGHTGQKIYIWAENVLGYLSACDKAGVLDDFFKNPDALHYYVHGKDNIPFHTIILPALLLAHGGGYHLPDRIISSEYVTLEGQKISTSRHHALWADDVLEILPPDSLRSFLLFCGPEQRDFDFTWRECLNHHNALLLGAFGNFVHRTLVFIQKYFDGRVPPGCCDSHALFQPLFISTEAHITSGHFRLALEGLFEAVRCANRFFDAEKPWITRTEDPQKCAQTLFACIQWIANLTALFSPFLPFCTATIREWLAIDASFALKHIPKGQPLPEPSILFERIDPKTPAPFGQHSSAQSK